MQPYIESMNQKRAMASQQQSEADNLGAMLSEMKKMQLAALMAQPQRPEPQQPALIRIDQADMADKLDTAITQLGNRMTTAIQALDSTQAEASELEALNNVVKAVELLKSSQEKSYKELKAAIKSIDVRPQVTVGAPGVTVKERPIDFGPLQATIREAMSQTETQSEALSTPPIEETGPDLDSYRVQDLKDNGDRQYIGYMNPEGGWYIIENDIKNNTMRYLFGASDYMSYFNNAAQYEYRLLGEAIDAAL